MLIFFLLLLLILSIAVLLQERLLNSVILLGVFSLISSVIYFLVGAPDVAVTEGAIGVDFVTFIYVLALSDQGKLHVLAEEIPPFLYQEKGELKGIEFEILNDFADSLDLNLEVEFVDHDRLVSGDGKKIANIFAGAYVRRYSGRSNILLTESFHREKIAKVESVDREGKMGTLFGIEPSLLPDKESKDLLNFPSLDTLVRAYNRKQIAGFIADSARVTEALKRIDASLQPQSEITNLGDVEYCFAVTGEEEELKEQLDEYLRKMKDSTELNTLISEHIRGK